MLGLGVLYTTSAAEDPEWAAIPERDRAARLREEYWARHAETMPSKVAGTRPFVNARLRWGVNRLEIGRAADDPGDTFVYLVNFANQAGSEFAWIEVTEAFTTVHPRKINDAMRALHGFTGKRLVNFETFRNSLPMGRPSRVAQRKAADHVIQQVKKKLAKASYRDLPARYGRGLLVLGMPLWFATLPDNPERPENVVDDFLTRTSMGLKDIERGELAKRDCPFRKVVVVWEPSAQALRTWRERRSADYGEPDGIGFGRSTSTWWSDVLLDFLAKEGASEVEGGLAVPLSLAAEVRERVRPSVVGAGPFPELVEAVEDVVHKAPAQVAFARRLASNLKSWFAKRRFELFWFLGRNGGKALLKLLVRKLSAPRALRKRAARRRVRRLYQESVRRGRFDSGSGTAS